MNSPLALLVSSMRAKSDACKASRSEMAVSAIADPEVVQLQAIEFCGRQKAKVIESWSGCNNEQSSKASESQVAMLYTRQTYRLSRVRYLITGKISSARGYPL